MMSPRLPPLPMEPQDASISVARIAEVIKVALRIVILHLSQ
jgi:hypothetical protein